MSQQPQQRLNATERRLTAEAIQRYLSPGREEEQEEIRTAMEYAAHFNSAIAAAADRAAKEAVERCAAICDQYKPNLMAAHLARLIRGGK